jgi:polysaccharide pyruvyl transferase WcaK-like protein
LLGATFSTNNLGVGALTAGALSAVLHHDPEAEVRLLDYGSASAQAGTVIRSRPVQVPLVNLRFSWKIFLPNNVALLLVLACLARWLPARIAGRIVAGNRWLSAIRQSDCALAISGGDSFSDIYGMARLLYVSLPQLLVVAMGKPLTLLPQTIGPFKSRLARALACFIMRRARVVYSRDKEGVHHARELLDLGPDDPKVRFCYDLGFLLEPHPFNAAVLAAAQVRQRPLVGLNVSGLLMIGGYTRSNAFALKADYADLTRRCIDMLIRRKQADVILVPHVLGKDAESDSSACEALHAELAERYPGRLHALSGVYNQNEVKHVIGQCDFFIGARMHACIAAVSQAVPAAAIAYSRKFVGVFDSVGAAELVTDPRNNNTEEILNRIEALFDDREPAHSRLKKSMHVVRSATLATAADYCPGAAS